MPLDGPGNTAGFLGLNEIDSKKLQEMVSRGLSLRQIGRFFGISKDTVTNILKRNERPVEDPPPKGLGVAIDNQVESKVLVAV